MDDPLLRRPLRIRLKLTPPSSTPQVSTSSVAMSRSRRSATNHPTNSSPAVTVTRSPSRSPEDKRKSIKLNFKMPASKLREVTGVNTSNPRASKAAASLRDSFGGGEIISGPRSSRNQQRKTYVDYDEDDDEDEEEEEEEDAEGEEDDDLDDFERVGAEAEGGTDDENIEMRDAPPPPTVKLKVSKPQQPATAKPPPRGVAAKPSPKQAFKSASQPIASQAAPVKAVEVKEMEEDPDDDEVLSDLDDEDEDEEDDEEEDDEDDDEDEEEDADGEEDEEMNDTTLPIINEPDAEGEEDEGEGGSEDELGINEDGSRASTPDYARLTKRQRGRGIEEEEGGFMALPMEPQIKKHFTAEEHRMRRAEMARRRKNLSEKRNEEEKVHQSPFLALTMNHIYLIVCRY